MRFHGLLICSRSMVLNWTVYWTLIGFTSDYWNLKCLNRLKKRKEKRNWKCLAEKRWGGGGGGVEKKGLCGMHLNVDFRYKSMVKIFHEVLLS